MSSVIRNLLLDRLLTKRKIQPVTLRELESHLLEIKGAKVVGLITLTEPKMRKTGNPYMGTMKLADRNVMLNFQYDAAVRRQLEREGKDPDSFVGGSSWHVPMLMGDRLTPLCMHKDDANRHYLRCLDRGLNMAEFVAPTGETVPSAALDPFIQKSTYANQGLDDPKRFMCPAVDNIMAVTDSGITYFVKH